MLSPKSSTLQAKPTKAQPPKAKAAQRGKKAKPLVMEQVPLVWEVPGLTAGVDEAGRGPLAGSVVAAAVILDDTNPIKGLADSKKLTALKRDLLYDEIRAKALCVSVGEASVQEIDQLNILQATMLAMQRAVAGLRLKPSMVLVDGNRLPKLDILAEAIVQGDAKVQAISAASIIAKVTRDRQCAQLHAQYPQYGFDSHKGYGTAVHMAALQAHGATPAHRSSFAPVRQAMAAQAAAPLTTAHAAASVAASASTRAAA
jgi:ribonuclease HII